MSSEAIVVLPSGANEWLAHGNRGISSNAIFTVLAGLNVVGNWGLWPPADPADFVRCEKLLRAVPAFRERLCEMSKVSPVWAGLVAHWDDLVTSLDEEIPDVWGQGQGMAPSTYRLMQKIEREAHDD